MRPSLRLRLQWSDGSLVVEAPRSGLTPRRGKRGGFINPNRTKLDVTDLDSKAGRILLRLVGQADAVIETFSGVPEAKAPIRRCVKKTSTCDGLMPAFGGTGPWAAFRAYSTVEQSSGPHCRRRSTADHVTAVLAGAIAGL